MPDPEQPPGGPEPAGSGGATGPSGSDPPGRAPGDQPGRDGREQPADAARNAHHDLIGLPHGDREGAIARAEAAADRLSTPEQPMGPIGPPMNRRAPFVRGMCAAAGAALVAGVVWLVVITYRDLILIGLALFIAVGFEPVVSWLVRHGWRRAWAVTAVVLGALAAFAGVLVGLVPVLVGQAQQFVAQLPDYLQQAQDPRRPIGWLNRTFRLREEVEHYLSTSGGVAGGLLGAGRVVLGGLVSTLLVVVLSVYFLADMRRVRTTIYRLVPAHRRPRAVLIGDAMFVRVGAYVLGQLVVAVIAGLSALVLGLVIGLPYPFLAAVLVAVLDLVPVAGSVTAGVLVSLLALTVSAPAALISVGFFVVYRVVEDYLLYPAIIGRVVRVPSMVTLLAVLLGFALYGIIGMIVAIPATAALYVLLHEVVFPRLDSADAPAPPPD